MKKWIVVILCIMAFSVGYANTGKDTSETSETDKKTERIIAEQKTREEKERAKEEKERKTCEECGHYGNDVMSNSALDDERRLCRECMSKARDKQRKADKEEKNKAEQQEEKKIQERTKIVYEDDDIIIKVRIDDMKRFIVTRAEGDFYVKMHTQIINKRNTQTSIGLINEDVTVNDTPQNGNNYEIIDTQLNVYNDFAITNYRDYYECIKDLDPNETLEFERLIVGRDGNQESRIVCNIKTIKFGIRINDSKMKTITVNNICVNNDSKVIEKMDKEAAKQKEQNKLEKRAQEVADKRNEERKETETNKIESFWNNANDKQLIHSGRKFKIYAFNKGFKDSKFIFYLRLENYSNKEYSFGIAAARHQANGRGRNLLSSSSYYLPIVYLNGIRYEGAMETEAISSYYPTYFIKGHTYIKCTIDSYNNYNIKSLNTVEFDIITEPVETPNLGEDLKETINIKFNAR